MKHVLNQERYHNSCNPQENKTRHQKKKNLSFFNFSMFLFFFFFNKNNLKNKTTKNKNKTCPQTIERIKSGTS